MVIRARNHLKSIPRCPHGSVSQREMAELGIPAGEVIDFSASCNPLGTSPAVLAAVRAMDLDRYPDDEALALRQALAERLAVQPEMVAVGNGSVELIWHLAMAFLEPLDRALVVGPTFGEYARACQVAGAEVVEIRAREENGFGIDPDEIVAAVRRVNPRLLFLCNPNNPTGQLIDAVAVRRVLDGCEDCLLVVDEAYLPFCDNPPDLRSLLPSGRLLLLRSMTKDHGLAGLRLGYAVAPVDFVDWLNRVRPPWNVSVLAQAAGLAAVSDEEHVQNARRAIAEARELLSGELGKLGLEVTPSRANFLLVRVGDGRRFRSALMGHGICVRDCASFGLPAYVRIGLRTVPDCHRLLEAVREVLAGD